MASVSPSWWTCWDQVEFATATLHVRRVKQGTPSTHPLLGDELRALRRLQREQEPKSPSCSPRNAGHRSAPLASPGWSNGRAGRPSWPSRRTRTCLDTLAVMPWPTRATTPAPCKPTSATATFSIPSGTLNCHRRGSRISGGTENTRRKRTACGEWFAGTSRHLLQRDILVVIGGIADIGCLRKSASYGQLLK